MNMLFASIVLTLLSVPQTTAGSTSAIIRTLCPTNCGCSMVEGSSPKLTVNCYDRADVEPGQLTKQLDSLLSSNVTHGRLAELSIVSTPLRQVPRSVCRLKALTQLQLDHNRLTRLPDNCFTNLTSLMSLSASQNDITELQNGLFDGLDRLERLQLSYNQISSIGLLVFNGSASLTSLRYVNLFDNRVQSLEPWPVYIGFNGQPGFNAVIDLRRNSISSFTNNMGWIAECGTRTVQLDIYLGYNPIRHISDFLHGWNVSLTTYLCLNPKIAQGIRQSQIHLTDVHLDCDCVDFEFFKFLSLFNHYTILDQLYCKPKSQPATLYDQKANTDPAFLEQLVCELTEQCPVGCRCVHRPANATLHVDCSNTNITDLPAQLPALPKSYTKYKLDFSNNQLLRRLEHRAYFINTSILDVSNCNIERIDFEVWIDLANMTQVFLGGNQLQSLPSLVATVRLANAHFDLSSNPWNCLCDARWMSNWLKSVRNNIIDPDSVVCSSPGRLKNRNVMGISETEFCVNPTREAVKRTLIISMSTVACVLFILVFVGVVAFRLRIKLYTRWKFHPFNRDECTGEDMDYDLFLSCSSSDNLPHGNGIREQLEQCGYRVCYPPRDFLAGGTIHENIYNAVVRSKRVVCLLTAQFLQRSDSVIL